MIWGLLGRFLVTSTISTQWYTGFDWIPGSCNNATQWFAKSGSFWEKRTLSDDDTQFLRWIICGRAAKTVLSGKFVTKMQKIKLRWDFATRKAKSVLRWLLATKQPKSELRWKWPTKQPKIELRWIFARKQAKSELRSEDVTKLPTHQLRAEIRTKLPYSSLRWECADNLEELALKCANNRQNLRIIWKNLA